MRESFIERKKGELQDKPSEDPSSRQMAAQEAAGSHSHRTPEKIYIEA